MSAARTFRLAFVRQVSGTSADPARFVLDSVSERVPRHGVSEPLAFLRVEPKGSVPNKFSLAGCHPIIVTVFENEGSLSPTAGFIQFSSENDNFVSCRSLLHSSAGSCEKM